ncbi:MAG: tautomerase enzyme [Phenylobacterium zucineum]|nr:MAG: tautomerase enzyme [Phenylobacterium zucineum]
MTIITLTSPVGRLTVDQRRELAESLTDAVLAPEVGQLSVAARAGFQVHFRELPADGMAIGGRLLPDLAAPDVMTVDIAVMDAAWPDALRAEVIDRTFAALLKACGLAKAPPTWWINFRVIEEGSWGSRGGVLSGLTLLDSGVFTPERAAAVRRALSSPAV